MVLIRHKFRKGLTCIDWVFHNSMQTESMQQFDNWGGRGGGEKEKLNSNKKKKLQKNFRKEKPSVEDNRQAWWIFLNVFHASLPNIFPIFHPLSSKIHIIYTPLKAGSVLCHVIFQLLIRFLFLINLNQNC